MNALLCCPKTRSVGVQTDPEFPFSCFPVAHLQWQHKCQPEETQLGAQPQRERERERKRVSMRGGMSKEERSTASWVKATPTLHEIKARPAHILPLTYKASVAQRLHTAAKSFIQPALTPRTESK